jgi:O-methyltransferase involved in polyketide biosynthesis
MTEKININLGNVQKTLMLPLWGRAIESKKSKPQLFDPTAVRIIEQVDFDFSQWAQNLDELSQIAWIKRSLLGDRVIKTFLEKYPAGTVVNVGCGLDTTFERIDNGKLTWYDLDLPDVIDLRRLFIAENERRKFIASSFLEKDWLEQITVQGNVLFMSAGVLYYFQEEVVKGFIQRLLEKFPGSEMLFDVCSPMGVKIANKKVLESAGMDQNLRLVWGLKDKKDLLAWDARIRLLGAYYYFRTLRLSPRNVLMGWLSDYLGIQYMLHLKLGEK